MAARHFAAAFRSVKVLSSFCPSVSLASQGRTALASHVPGQHSIAASLMGSMQQHSLSHGSMSGLSSLMQRQSAGQPHAPGSLLPAALSSISTSCAASVCTSAGAGAAAGGLGASVGEEGSDDESTPHSRRRTLNEAELNMQAQMAMGDPLTRLMASRGMPLGISMDAIAEAPSVGMDSSSSAPRSAYPMEALDEIFDTTKAKSQQEVQGAGTPEVVVDSWGTTKEGPAEIARRIAESNRALEAMELPEEDPIEEDDPTLVLAPGEAKYRTLEEMSKDIKELDEVFDVLASVPWLDETNVQQKELKGVAMYGLLGTLEEVGFNIRSQVHKIWAGERDHGVIITECSEAKDQAALISILFHTKRLEEEHGQAKPCKV